MENHLYNHVFVSVNVIKYQNVIIGSKPHPPAVMIIFFFRFKESTIATEAMHAFQWPKAHALPPWLQKRTVHQFFLISTTIFFKTGLFHNKLSNTYLHLIIDTCKKKMHVNDQNSIYIDLHKSSSSQDLHFVFFFFFCDDCVHKTVLIDTTRCSLFI